MLSPTNVKVLHETIDLTGEVAIVTGGANGIGWGLSFRLSEAGAAVLIADLAYVSASPGSSDASDGLPSLGARGGAFPRRAA